MKIIRQATIKDKEEFKNLWNLSFNDSAEFRAWIFDNRFVPDYSICIEEDGKIVSEAQSIPYHIKVRDSIVAGTVMVGACTHPDYKKRGYMKELYIGYMNMVKDMGACICAHTPAVLGTYFNVGHLPVSDTTFIEIKNAQPLPAENVEEIDLKTDVSRLLNCYTKAIQSYSGVISRSFTDFKLKMDDYSADGGKCIAVVKNGQIVSYAIYYNTQDMLYGEEIISLTSDAEQKIVNALINIGEGKKVKIKLPPNTKSTSNQGAVSLSPRNVLGLANAKKLLKAVGKNLDYSVEVKDDVVKENNGIFDLSGKNTSRAPAISLSAGNLTQWLVGYKTIKELAKDGKAVILNKTEAEELDILFPKAICHIIDEY